MKSSKEAPKPAVKSPSSLTGRRKPRPSPTVEEIRAAGIRDLRRTGRRDGHDLEGWFQAEKALTRAIRTPTSA